MSGNGAGVWLVVLAGWGLVAVTWLAWLAARVAAALAGRRIPPFGERWVYSLLRGHTAATWPGTPTLLVIGIGLPAACLAGAVVAVACRFTVRRIPRPEDPVAALARNPQIAELASAAAARNAIRLRPSLAKASPRSLSPGDTGLLLGDLLKPSGPGPALFASWEDTTIAVMAPRSGKTTTQGIPHILSAPGPVAATSVRADLWAATSELRAGTGTVWVFDPLRVTAGGQLWWTDLLAGLRTKEAATRLAAHFVLTVDDEHKRDIWGPAAKDLLCALFLAAATSGRTLREVDRWLGDAASPVPSDLLERAGFDGLASSLRGMQHGAPETRDGIYQTARTAAACLNDEEILPWVTPPRGRPLPVFDPARFAASRDTLYLITETGTAAAPLIAALADAVMRAGKRRAERSGGRLDPPMTAILDEAANICRIADLPSLYSHLGGRGVIPVTILQSYEQGITVWGEQGMAALWGAATKKLIGAGVDSPRLTRDIATLVGQHDVPVQSVSYGDGRASVQVSLRRQEILEAAAIRALPPGTALLFATGARAALIRLRPWYSGPDAARIRAATTRAEDAIRAVSDESPDAPGEPGRTADGVRAGQEAAS
jgi:type IV secretory pathway TraG/TraD family ATPase VirD4